jgi:hypothetical protein
VNDLFRASKGDIVIMLADDVEVLPGAVQAVVAAFEKHFPMLDGMVGMNQTNIPSIKNCTEFAFFGVGRKFLERFPDHQAFCPDYHHFYGDTELGLYAKSLRRFKYAKDARIVHNHPAYSSNEPDATHAASRSHKDQDKNTWAARQARGLLWGREFTRVSAE